MTEETSFKSLVDSIQQIHGTLTTQASKAINISLTLRNWAIGAYIREYEQNGSDRAEYGSRLFIELSHKLDESRNIKYHPRELRRCRAFYEMYPQIREALSPQFDFLISGTIQKAIFSKLHESYKPAIRGTVSPEFQIPAENLVNSLSFSHFVSLIKINNPLKRVFYEIECIRSIQKSP